MPNPKFKAGAKSKSRVELEGIEDLERALAEVGDGVRAVLTEAAQAGAEIVKAEAQRRAPVLTGNLAANIEAKPSGKVKNSAAQQVGPNRNAWYGVQVELGHNIVRAGKIVGHVPAQPYLRPAVVAAAQEVETAVGRIFSAALARV